MTGPAAPPGRFRGLFRGRARDRDGDPEGVAQAAVRLPRSRYRGLADVLGRAAIATALLLATAVIIYIGRRGYYDAARGGPPGLADALYYATVTLSTTGYGDIVPVTTASRLINTFLLTPMRVIFLIVVVSATVEVFAERTRNAWRVFRWRSKLAGHTVLVGYGTTGRTVLGSLREAGIADGAIVTVDMSPERIAEANTAGLTAVAGDATRLAVQQAAGVPEASCLVVAVGRDDSAVLITLTARQLNPGLAIIASVHEAENEPLLRQSGADQVVVSAETAGRMLALSAIEPAAGAVLTSLAGRSLGLIEWPAGPDEIGQPATGIGAGTIALVRDGSVLALDDARAGQVEPGDRLVRVSAAGSRPAGAV